MPKEIKIYDSADLKARIRGKYPAPAWVVLEELRDGTGFQTQGREADSVAFGTWPSRGFQIIGFEVKSRRSDWLQELKRPEKQETIGQFCDQWWIVCAQDVAKLEEIPPAWGWLGPASNGLKVLKPALDLNPIPADRVLLMSIVRNVAKNYQAISSLEELINARAKKISDDNCWHTKHAMEEFEKLKNRVAKFKETSGIDIESEWRQPVEHIGRIVNAVLNNNLRNEISQAKRAYDTAKTTLESLEAMELFKGVVPEKE